MSFEFEKDAAFLKRMQSFADAKLCYAQQGEDLVLRRLLGRNMKKTISEGGFYIDCGGYHHTQESVTRFLYDLGWDGIVVDMSETSIEGFRQHRPRDIAICCAVAEHDGQIEGYFFGDVALTNTCDEDFALRMDGGRGKIKKRSIPAKSLSTIIQEHDVKEIDFLNIDLEGFELPALNGFPFDKVKPRCIAVEIHGRSIAAVASTDVFRKIVENGYTHVASTVITHFFLRD